MNINIKTTIRGAFVGLLTGSLCASGFDGILYASYPISRCEAAFIISHIGSGEFANCTLTGTSKEGIDAIRNSAGDNDCLDINTADVVMNSMTCLNENTTQKLLEDAKQSVESDRIQDFMSSLPIMLGIVGAGGMIAGGSIGIFMKRRPAHVELKDIVVEQNLIAVATPLQDLFDKTKCTDEIPEKFIDQIDCKLMDNPMILSDGNILDARTIDKLIQPKTSPFSRQPIIRAMLDVELKKEIET